MAIGDILVRVGADISQYQKAMQSASTAALKFGGVVTSIGAGITTAMLGITASSTIGLVTVLNVASKYETAFSSVRKVVDGTEQDFDKLSKGIRNLAKEIPLTTEELAGIAAVAGQLGIEKENIIQFTDTMAQLGIASDNLSAEEAATSLARFANITAMSITDVDRLGSTIVDLSNNLATSEKEIVEMGLRLAGAGHQAGMSDADIMALSGTLSSLGVRAEAGGTAMSKFMLDMNSAVKGGGESLQQFADVAGMSADDFAKSFEDDAAGAILLFVEGMNRMAGEGKDLNKVLDDMGIKNWRTVDALLRMSGDTELLADAINLGSDAWEKNTALAEAAQERYDTFASKLRVVMNRLKDFVLIIGGPILGVFSEMLDALDPLLTYLEGLAKKFEDLDDKTKRTVAIIMTLVPVAGLVGAAFGILIMVIGGIISVIGVASILLSALGLSMGVVIGVIAVIAAYFLKWAVIIGVVVTAMGVLWKESELFRDKMAASFRRVWDVVVEIFTALIDYFKEVGRKLVDFWKKEGDNIVKALEVAFLAVYTVVSSVFEKIYPIFKRVWSNIGDILLNFLDIAIEVISWFSAIINGDFKRANQSAGEIVKSTWEIIKGVFKVAFDVLIGQVIAFLSGLVSAFSGKWKEVEKDVVDFLVGIRDNFASKMAEWTVVILNWFKEMPGKIGDKFSEWTKIVKGWFVDTGRVIAESLSNWGTSIAGWFTDTAGRFGEWLAGWTDAIITWFSEMPSKIYDKLVEWSEALETWAEEQDAENRRQFGEWWTTISEWFDEARTGFVEKLGEWWETIGEWFEESKGKLGEKLGGWAETLLTWFGEIPGKITAKLAEWWEAIGTWYDETKTNIGEKLGGWWTTISEWFTSAPAKIGGFLSEWWTKMKTWFSDTRAHITESLEGWWETIKTWFVGVPDKPEIKNMGKNMIDKVSEGNYDKKDEFISKLGRLIIDVAKAALGLAFIALVAVGREIIRDIIDGMSNMRQAFIGKMGEIVNAGVQFIRGISLWGIGRDLIRGLIRGVASMGGSVISAASGIASKFLGAFRKTAGIFSPSRETFADGLHIVQGLINGIAKQTNPLRRAADELAEAAMPNVGEYSLDYATPNGNFRSLSSAVSGTVDVNSSDEALIVAINELRRDMTNLKVEMEGVTVGRIIKPHIDEESALDSTVGRYF